MILRNLAEIFNSFLSQEKKWLLSAGCCFAQLKAAASVWRTQESASGQDAADPTPPLLRRPQLGQGQGPRGHFYRRSGKREEDKLIAI